MIGPRDLLQPKKRAALVVDQFPLPPRNGITIPAAQILDWMISRGYLVDIWYLGGSLLTENELSLVPAEGVQLFMPKLIRVSSATRVWREVRASPAAFDRLRLPLPSELDGGAYDVTVSTPLSVGVFAPYNLNSRKHIIAINDSYFAVLKTYPFKNRLLRYGNRLRAAFVRRAEHATLEVFDEVVVQTEKDRDWLCRGPGERLRRKTHCIHNAVHRKLLDLPYTGDHGVPRVLFVGDLSNELYQKNLLRFHHIWSKLSERVPEAMFEVAGSGLSSKSKLARKFAADPSVKMKGFVPDIVDIYRGVRIVVALIDKNYGFMNKVAEAIACGIPVIGDTGAFNGLSEFVDKGAVVVTTDDDSLERELFSLLTDESRVRKMSAECKLIGPKHLTHQSFFASMDSVLNDAAVRHRT